MKTVQRKPKRKVRKKLRYKKYINIKPNKELQENRVTTEFLGEFDKNNFVISEDSDEHPENYKGPVHPYASGLKNTEWMGMITIKFYDYQFFNGHKHGEGRENRFKFAGDLMKNLCCKAFKIKESCLKWVACDEFGEKDHGHVHIIFSFDYLKSKGRVDKIPKIDFSDEKGEFFVKMNESANFLWEKLKKKVGKLDVHWKPMDENDGLVNYVCKIKFECEEKSFKFSDYWRIHEGLIAA